MNAKKDAFVKDRPVCIHCGEPAQTVNKANQPTRYRRTPKYMFQYGYKYGYICGKCHFFFIAYKNKRFFFNKYNEDRKQELLNPQNNLSKFIGC